MSQIKPKTLLHRTDQGVAWITLNRPTAQNRVNLQLATELRDLCLAIRQDDEIRGALLTGAGDAFCAGDEDSPPAQDAEDMTSYLEARRVASFLGDIEKPIIAAINGDAIGHGLEMALACDIRLAAATATLGMPQISQGSIPWDGGTQRLPRIVGRAWAADLLLTGRLIDAAEALKIGLVHQVLPPDQLIARAEQLAVTIAALGPIAARYAKEAVLKGMDMTLGQGMRLEMDLNLILQTTEDRAEGIASFFERRKPRFIGE